MMGAAKKPTGRFVFPWLLASFHSYYGYQKIKREIEIKKKELIGLKSLHNCGRNQYILRMNPYDYTVEVTHRYKGLDL